MQFNSYVFILLFLPLFLIIYLLMARSRPAVGKFVIIIAGFLFYAYGSLKTLPVLCASLIINLLFSWLLAKHRDRGKVILFLAIAANVSILFYFKYRNFACDLINYWTGGTSSTGGEIIIPLGISFFTFQQIMYLLAIYRKELTKVNALDYLAYVLYFPKLIMGPLAVPKDIIDQLNNKELKRVNWDNVVSGITLFSLGLFKKLLLADNFAKGVAWGFSNIERATSADLFIVMLFFTFEIYFDFSGYSDMAIGISRMINISLPMNFDSPYKALSVREFWKRWHMSLTAFLTKNIYIPLGGSKMGTARTCLNIMIVFLISGIWHGANWSFILWGGLHGLLQILERLFDRGYGKLPKPVQWLYTFLAVNILWFLFRAESVSEWWNLLMKMFSFQDITVSTNLLKVYMLSGIRIRSLRTPLLLCMPAAALFLCLIPENNCKRRWEPSMINMLFIAGIFVLSVLFLGYEAPFVYWDF